MKKGKFEGAEGSSPKKNEELSLQENILLSFHDVCYLLAVVLVVLLVCFRMVVVSGTSMNDTLLDGDYLLLLTNVFYQEPKQGDIVVISKDSFDDGAPIVKRVIAVEGQTVDIDFDAGIVYVDGVALDEPSTYSSTTTSEGVTFPLVVEEGCVFVLGDNRAVSRDSRYPAIGQVDTREILGKAIYLLIPGTEGGTRERQFYRIGAIA